MTPASGAMRAAQRAVAAAGWALFSAPFVLFAVLLPRFGRLPRNDYWNDFNSVLDADGRILGDPVRWLTVHSNEHLIGLHLPVWFLNAITTGGDNRALALLTLLYLVATTVLIMTQLPDSIRANPTLRAIWAVPIAALTVTPAAAHNWALGFSGNQWLLTNLLAVAALALLCKPRLSAQRRVGFVAVLYGLAVFSHSSFLALGPAIVVGAWLLRRSRRELSILSLLALVATSAAAIGYRRPSYHSGLQTNPLSMATATAEYVGAVASESTAPARLFGALGLVLFGGATFALVRRRPGPGELFWYLLALYALGNALLSAIARSVWTGGFWAAASRYASLPALFWLGTLGFLLIELRREGGHDRVRRLAALALAGLLAGLLAANGILGLRRLHRQLRLLRTEPVVELAMRWDLWDPEIESGLIHLPSKAARAFFRRIGHVPFDLAPEGPPGAVRNEPIVTDSGVARGQWEETTVLEPRLARVRGTARLPAGASRAVVLFLDSRRRVRGAAAFLPEEALDPRLLFRRPPRSGEWIGYVRPRFLAELRAVVEIEGDGTLHELQVTAAARSRGRADPTVAGAGDP